ncbi:MAG: DNA/RNA non-specific endonuclease [Pyrinomonadaceae bacterium]|nr:DNA/RNA non-specific endonuclease [Pyrinomonadaceae bacterium]
MKRFYISFAGAAALAVYLCLSFAASAKNDVLVGELSLVSPHLVISQFQTAGGGGNPANDELIEIHNTSNANVDLNGYRLVYRSAGGTNDVTITAWTTSVVVPAGGYHLIVNSSYDGSVPGDTVFNSTTCSCALSASGGGLGIRFGEANTGVIIDSVGYGSATNAFIETAVTAAPPANSSQARVSNGCQDTDNNSADFSNVNPSAPKNASSTPNQCAGSGSTLLANGAASPSTVAPNVSTRLTVSVFPATSPPSTGIAVSGNLTNIGGSAVQQFFDDGTNGDVTPGDNVFSYSATIPNGTTGGPTSVNATASDAQARTANVTINITIDAPLEGENPLLLGNPSNATTNVANENNFLMNKAQYSLSYSRANATPNWVAWRLDSSWIGSASRQDDYRPDPALPSGWYQVQDNDYSGSGYDRGHMCPSGDRTRSIPDNSATFLMTNFIPQLGANNQGPWNDFEIYLRSLAGAGNEIYIFSGGHGNAGTIAQGRIVVPQVTWKVALVLPNGNNDLSRVNKTTRTIAIIVPNQPPVSNTAPWRNFRTTVKAVEALTGFDFFSNVPKNTQQIIERKRDYQ